MRVAVNQSREGWHRCFERNQIRWCPAGAISLWADRSVNIASLARCSYKQLRKIKSGVKIPVALVCPTRVAFIVSLALSLISNSNGAEPLLTKSDVSV